MTPLPPQEIFYCYLLAVEQPNEFVWIAKMFPIFGLKFKFGILECF